MSNRFSRSLGVCLAAVAALVAFVGSATAHVEYVTPPGAQPANVVEFLVAAFTTPIIVGVLGVGFVAVLAGIGSYLYLRPFPADIAAFREAMDDYRDLLGWLLRLSMGMPLIAAGFQGYLFSPSATLPYPTALRLFGISVGFFLLFGLATRVTAVWALFVYLVTLPSHPQLLLAFEYVPGLIAVALVGGGRPSADAVIARMADDDKTLYSRIDPFYRRVAVPFAERVTPYKQLAPVILRVGIGIAFIYLGITQKLLRPGEALAVVEKYNLTGLVPVDPALWVIGAGLTEALVGVMFIFGAFTRGFSLVAFGLFTTTLFGLPDDPVVAHISLFGLVSALLITGSGPYSVDAWLKARIRTAGEIATQGATPSEPEPVDETVSDN